MFNRYSLKLMRVKLNSNLHVAFFFVRTKEKSDADALHECDIGCVQWQAAELRAMPALSPDE